MTTMRELIGREIIGSVEALRSDRVNRFTVEGPLVISDIKHAFSNWNTGKIEMQIKVSAFDIEPVWLTVFPSDTVHVIMG